jgi:uncharacterized membrane protein YqaE (UPF0057 family)
MIRNELTLRKKLVDFFSTYLKVLLGSTGHGLSDGSLYQFVINILACLLGTEPGAKTTQKIRLCRVGNPDPVESGFSAVSRYRNFHWILFWIDQYTATFEMFTAGFLNRIRFQIQ